MQQTSIIIIIIIELQHELILITNSVARSSLLSYMPQTVTDIKILAVQCHRSHVAVKS
jgi:hypothetical protein